MQTENETHGTFSVTKQIPPLPLQRSKLLSKLPQQIPTSTSSTTESHTHSLPQVVKTLGTSFGSFAGKSRLALFPCLLSLCRHYLRQPIVLPPFNSIAVYLIEALRFRLETTSNYSWYGCMVAAVRTAESLFVSQRNQIQFTIKLIQGSSTGRKSIIGANIDPEKDKIILKQDVRASRA